MVLIKTLLEYRNISNCVTHLTFGNNFNKKIEISKNIITFIYPHASNIICKINKNSLLISKCKYIRFIKLGNVHTLYVSGCQIITNLSKLRNVKLKS